MASLALCDLADGQVGLIATKTDLASRWLDQSYANYLSLEEKIQNARYRFARDKRRDRVVRVLVRKVLGEALDLPPESISILRDAKGKPHIHHAGTVTEVKKSSPASWQFNVTHSGGWVVIAIARAVVGVDIEYVPRSNDVLAIAEHYFHPREVKQLFSLPVSEQRAGFFNYWTLKEAYIKARGEGISLGLKKFGFDFSQQEISLYIEKSIDEVPSDWSFICVSPIPDYRLAVALRKPSMTMLHSLQMCSDGELVELDWALAH